MDHTTLHLFKQNFKFSSAHFLIFNETSAEKLHGHNYQVRVDLKVPPEKASARVSSGYFIDFNVFKKFIKDSVDRWDEHVLLPALHPEMKVEQKGSTLEVRFRERFYAFPVNEVILLPVTNTSVEQFSKLLAESFFHEFHKKYGVDEVTVMVEETQGQGASHTIRA